MTQRGFIPLYILIVILIIGIGSVFVYSKQITINQPTVGTNDQKQATPSASAVSSSSPTTKSSAFLLPAKSPTPKSNSLNPEPSLSPTPTVSPAPAQAQVQVLTTKKNTCKVNIIYGKMGGGDSDPYLVTLVYAFLSHNNAYMTGAQWDFDGNGDWDTDLKQSNGTIEHTYNGGGNYSVRLQLQDSNGVMADVCTKTFNLPGAIAVSLNGQVYNDLNCNNSKDSNENGVSGAILAIMTPGGLVYETVTTDANGNYSFSKRIKMGDSITVEPSPNIHNGIKFYPPAVTLNSQNSTSTTNVSVCP